MRSADSSSHRLNIGCGEYHADGWTNVDLHRDGPKPDVTASILSLPFRNATVDRVYLGHMLEHIALDDLPRALSEVHRILRPAGEMAIVGPDIGLTAIHEPVLMDCVIHGGHRWPGDEHKYVATGALTLVYVQAAGFEADLLPVNEVPEPWPVVDRAALWQFAILARPKG